MARFNHRFLITIAILISLAGMASAAHLPPSWQWYVNDEDGIKIAYPQTIKPQNVFTQTYLLPTSWSLLADKPLMSGQKSIVQFTLAEQQVKTQYLGTQNIRVFLRIGASTRKGDLATCYQARNTEQVHNVTLNGRQFKLFDYSDSAMMHALTAKIYRYKTADTCYSLEVINIFPDTQSKAVAKILRRGDHAAKKMLSSVTVP